MPNWITFFTWCLTLNTMDEKDEKTFPLNGNFTIENWRGGNLCHEIYVTFRVRKFPRSFSHRFNFETIFSKCFFFQAFVDLLTMTPRRSRVIYFYWFFTHNPKQKKKCFLSCHLGVAYFHPSLAFIPYPTFFSFDLVSSVSFCFLFIFLFVEGRVFFTVDTNVSGEKEWIFFFLWIIAILNFYGFS